MRLVFRIALTVAGCVGGAIAAHAQSWLDQPALGGGQSASVGVATVPLPPGQWTQVEQDVKPHPGEYDVVVQRKGFMQVEAGRVVALTIIEANAKPADSGHQPRRALRHATGTSLHPPGCPSTVSWSNSASQKDDLTAPRRAYLDKVVAWSRGYRAALKPAMNP